MDIDEPQLQIARREADAAGIANIDYRLADAAVIADAIGGGFDLVYARFLLTHLPAPEEALAALAASARAGGIVAVEDIDIDGYFWHPPSPALDQYLDWYRRAHRARGGDPTIGRRLPGLLRDAGLTDIDIRVVQPAGTTGDIKWIAPLTLSASADAIRTNGIATAAEIDRLHADLEAFSADPTTLVSMPRVVQAWGTRG
jgi:SAM-dependent methyltransferase